MLSQSRASLEGGEVGLLEALVVAVDGAQDGGPRLPQHQDPLRLFPLHLIPLRGNTVSSGF